MIYTHSAPASPAPFHHRYVEWVTQRCRRSRRSPGVLTAQERVHARVVEGAALAPVRIVAQDAFPGKADLSQNAHRARVVEVGRGLDTVEIELREAEPDEST